VRLSSKKCRSRVANFIAVAAVVAVVAGSKPIPLYQKEQKKLHELI